MAARFSSSIFVGTITLRRTHRLPLPAPRHAKAVAAAFDTAWPGRPATVHTTEPTQTMEPAFVSSAACVAGWVRPEGSAATSLDRPSGVRLDELLGGTRCNKVATAARSSPRCDRARDVVGRSGRPRPCAAPSRSSRSEPPRPGPRRASLRRRGLHNRAAEPPAPPVTSAVRIGMQRTIDRPAPCLRFMKCASVELTRGRRSTRCCWCAQQPQAARARRPRRHARGRPRADVAAGSCALRVAAAWKPAGACRSPRARRRREGVLARRPARRPADRRRAHGGRPARADRDDPVRPPARAAGRGLPRGHRDVGAVPRGTGGQALPPGLSPRAARALLDGRAERERRSRPRSAAWTATWP